ncbi:MAG: antibiotic biosynthesis monooxygenase family protein [Acidimicrobiales bacterium]|jgi:quinol monooxygenase YgiN
MMLEHALLNVRAGQEEEFERSMVIALPLIESAPDCHGAEVRRQEENGSVYLLLVRWTSVAAHQVFRETPLFEEWRKLTHHFYSERPSVTHFNEPVAR